ncbi:hypothetical protein NQ318_023052, partial [Aromia moschata]
MMLQAELCKVSFKSVSDSWVVLLVVRPRSPFLGGPPHQNQRDNVPPPGWQPFLPRVSRDLKSDHWVKVITPEGRVRGGRVRYVGPVISQTEQFVGVQLSNPDGYCDGTYSGRRYFQ